MINGIVLSNDTATVCIEEGNCTLVLNCFLYWKDKSSVQYKINKIGNFTLSTKCITGNSKIFSKTDFQQQNGQLLHNTSLILTLFSLLTSSCLDPQKLQLWNDQPVK